MKQTKKYLSERKFYPVFFMIILTVIFVGVLAVFYHLTQARVQTYKAHQFQKMVLLTLDLPVDQMEQNYDTYITEESQSGFDYYFAKRNDDIIGYCFEIEGSGLWGTINALIALNQDFSELIGFSIIDQNETPGLGARITEEWFQKQFQDKKIRHDGEVIKFTMVPENDIQENNQVQQITGATSSTRTVVDMLNKHLVKIIQEFKPE
ncbi:MAG: FMN-binding protein [Candidatus Cloacimonetes bacterium]|nr:FMN-binding protein [Candidatus Cloacimonadota bacterium]